MGMAVFPPCCLIWGQNMVEVVKIMGTSFKRSHASTATLSAPNPEGGHCWPRPLSRLLDTHGIVWVSFYWGHFSFLLGPGAHKVLFVPSKSLFPQSCVSSGGAMVGLMATSSNRAYALPRLSCTSTGDMQTQFWLRLCGLGWHVVPFPGLSRSGDQVLGEHTVPCGPCVFITSLVPTAWFPECAVRAPSQVSHMSPLGSWSQAPTLLANVNHPGSQKDLGAAGSLLTVWWKMPALGLRLQQPLSF